MKTVIIKIEKDSSLKLILDFVKKLKLKAKVVESEKNKEQEEWNSFSAKGLANAYGENEPDYTLNMVKESNPAYKRKK